jgi:hypothetical protein
MVGFVCRFFVLYHNSDKLERSLNSYLQQYHHKSSMLRHKLYYSESLSKFYQQRYKLEN